MRAAALLPVAALPSTAHACAVCFGKNEQLALGLNWGIFLLLSCTALGVGGIFAAAARIEKARLARELASAAEQDCPPAAPLS